MRKTKSKTLTGIIWGTGIILAITALTIWITGYGYIFRTLIYTYPGIDDLEIFDTRIIKDNAPSPWPVSADYNKKELPDTLLKKFTALETVAFLVVKNDSIIYERYYDNYNASSLSNSFSVSKSIVGMLTGIAVGDGLFSLDDEVGKYIPSFSEGDNKKLKIRHLLMMSSGLNWDESYNSLFSMTTEAYYGRNLEALVAKLNVVEEPGVKFSYMSCNTVLLALIIAKTSGMTISDYASAKLWSPIGATQPAYWSLDHHEGLEKSYCCFYSNARDFARIGKLYLDSGRWNHTQIIPGDYVLQSVSPNGSVDETGKPAGYGFHWWLMNFENHNVFYARGILGQYIIVIPDEKLIIVRLGRLRGEKTANNQYSDMISYTKNVLHTFGTHL